jgi:hypothetical protein
MQRRDVLRLVGGLTAFAGIAPDRLLALGRQTHRLVATPRGFFDDHQMRTVAAAGERILPATDTPGALAAGCERFTERIVADRYDADRQARFIAGLVDFDRRASRHDHRLFVDLDAEAQDGVLAAVEDDAYLAHENGADSFWHDLKALTLYGYYTSRIGIEEELRTPRIPGHFDGAMPIAEEGR